MTETDSCIFKTVIMTFVIIKQACNLLVYACFMKSWIWNLTMLYFVLLSNRKGQHTEIFQCPKYAFGLLSSDVFASH